MIENAGAVVKLLEKAIGVEAAVIHHEKPFFVLVSTVLSQRTRDENTEKASRKLFKPYDTPEKLASAPLRKIEPLIKESGFYKTKARYIKELSKELIAKHKGQVPSNIDELLTLPGVGRKTANCVLVYGFGKSAIPVDTHVHRISNRLGWVNTKKPEDTEKKLEKELPRRYWVSINNLMVKFGQNICQPIKPRCEKCPLTRWCAYYKNISCYKG